MGKSITNYRLTSKYVLSKVSQISIFSYYLNISPDVIKYCIENNELIKSPLREDNHPTCGFRYRENGKLIFRDFAGYFWGDCFDLVAFIMSKIDNIKYDVNNKEDFIKILKCITKVFKSIFYGNEKDDIDSFNIEEAISKIRKEKAIFDIVTRQWNKQDILYWQQFDVDIGFLNINFIYPVDQYYINRKLNPEPKYYYKPEDPCYAYFLGKDRNNINNFKFYFPKRTKEEYKFITNCNHLEGIINLTKDKYDIIVITKSTKDRVSIGNAIIHINSLYGQLNKTIGVINIPHETYKLRQIEYDWLHSKLNDNGLLVSLMDNDRTGLIESKWLKDNYNILSLIIPKNTGCKDFSEYIQKYTLQIVYKDIIELLNNKNKIYDVQFNRRQKESVALPF